MKLPFELLGSLQGCKIKIVESKDKSLQGIYGKIYNETRNTFEIAQQGKSKIIKVIKRVTTFVIEKEGKKWLVKGKALENRQKLNKG